MSNIILKLKLLHVTHPLILRIQFVKVRSRMALIGLGRARGQKHGPTLTNPTWEILIRTKSCLFDAPKSHVLAAAHLTWHLLTGRVTPQSAVLLQSPSGLRCSKKKII